MYGRQGGGCGATIGVMPRCDFACRGCYLGAEANHVPAADLAELRRQIDRLREQLGDGGDLQLTDGEVTLRPVNELIELIRYARGRTDPSIAAVVDVADLWRAIADGVIEDGESGVQQRRAEFLSSHVHFGHPACNRVLPGLAARSGRRTRYVPLWRPHVERERRSLEAFFSRFGGITFRRDGALERMARLLAIIIRDPLLFVRGLTSYAIPLARRVAPPNGLARFAWEFLRARARVDSLLLVSHHFMSSGEVQTRLGHERLQNCVFHVPVGNELVPMCAANAAGDREEFYRALSRAVASRHTPGVQSRRGVRQD